MKSSNAASTSQDQETLDGFVDSSDNLRNTDEEMPIRGQILGGQATFIDNWVDDPNLREWKDIVLAECNENGNGPRRILVNEYDHDDTSWEHVRAVSPGSLSLSSCSSSSESDFEVIGHDGERVDQESWRGARVKVDGEGAGSENQGAVGSENEVRVLPTVPPAEVSLEPYCQMLPVGYVADAINNNEVIVQVTYANIPPLSQGMKIWVTRSWFLLGVIDRISGPAGRCRYIVRCNIDGDVPSRVQLGTSVSIVQGLADRVQSDKDEKVPHWDDLSDDRKKAACKQMLETAERKNDQRQRNCAGNRQAPIDQNVNTRGMSYGSQAPSQEDTSRENVGASQANAGPSQPRQTHGSNLPAPSTSVNPSNQFNPTAIRQVPPGIFGAPAVAPPPGVAPYISHTPVLQPLHLNSYTSDRLPMIYDVTWMQQNPFLPLTGAMQVLQQLDPCQGLCPVTAHAAPQLQMNASQVPNYSPHGISYEQDFPQLPASRVGSNEPLAGPSDALRMQSIRASRQHNQVPSSANHGALSRGQGGHSSRRRGRHQQ